MPVNVKISDATAAATATVTVALFDVDISGGRSRDGGRRGKETEEKKDICTLVAAALSLVSSTNCV